MNKNNPPLMSVFIFTLWAIPQTPWCWPRRATGGVQLSTPRRDTNTWRSSETRMAPEPRQANMSPLSRLPWLAIKGSSRTSRQT